MNIMSFLPKQRKGNRIIGGIIVLIQRCQFYFSLLNFLMISSMFYVTVVKNSTGSFLYFYNALCHLANINNVY